MKYKDFEEYLDCECCPPERQTNNDPAGFENWLEEQDVNDIMGYADEYAEQVRKEMQDLMDLKLAEQKNENNKY